MESEFQDFSHLKELEFPHKNAWENKLIILVEDDELNTSLITETLNEYNAEILHANNGLYAIELVKNNPGVDLVLLDINIPLLNGFDCCNKIKQFDPSIPVIAQTAYGDQSLKTNPNYWLFDGFIFKPFQLQELVHSIHKYLL